MAVTLATGEYKSHRSDLIRVDPRGIDVDWSKNIMRGGREPEIDDELKALALSMVPKKGPGDKPEGSSGQLEPVVVRKRGDRTLELVCGYRRMAGALWLINSETYPEFEIECKVFDKMSDVEATLANIEENIDRLEPSPVDLAHAVRCLSEGHGMDMKTIAVRLKRGEKWLKKLLGLTALPSKIQESVNDGKTAIDAALEIAREPSNKHITLFNEARDTNGRVTVAAVKDRVRETREGPTPRSAKHIRVFCEQYDVKGEPGRDLARSIIGFIEGKPKSEENLQKTWDKIFSVPE